MRKLPPNGLDGRKVALGRDYVQAKVRERHQDFVNVAVFFQQQVLEAWLVLGQCRAGGKR